MERNRAQLFWAACLFGLIAAASATGAFAAVKDFANARASGNWVQVGGVVLSPDAGARRGWLVSSKMGLRYAYFYNGETYEGRRFAFLTRGRIGAPPSTAAGARVTVYVSPDDPTMSVLVPGGSGRRFAIWFAGAGAIAFVGVGGLIRSMMAVDFPEFDARPPAAGPSPEPSPTGPAPGAASAAPLVDRYYQGEDGVYYYRGDGDDGQDAADRDSEPGDKPVGYDDDGRYATRSLSDGRAASTW